METPDSPSHICLPEETTKKTNEKSSDDEGKTYIKFLLSNVAAGSVIGKGGATITDFQLQSGARVQLSRSNELFPGTSDRIIMVTGTINEITKAMKLILGKLLNEIHSEDEGYVNVKSKLRIIVPNGSCGGIIGKGGSIIKSFIENSQAGIKISPLDHNFVGLNDRIVTLTGSIEEQMQAIFLILSKLKEDSHYLVSLHSPFSYKVRYNEMYNGSNGFSGRHQSNKDFAAQVNSRKSGGHEEDMSNSVTIGVADEHIGVVLGRGGQAIMEITQVTGARIKVSDRGDFISGTSDRKVTITGTQTAIHAAQSMINNKISAHSKD